MGVRGRIHEGGKTERGKKCVEGRENEGYCGARRWECQRDERGVDRGRAGKKR